MSRCKVCKSAFKDYYHKLRREGTKIKRIYNECIKLQEDFSEQSLYRHFQNHYSKKEYSVLPSNCVIGHIFVYLFRSEDVYILQKKLTPLLMKYPFKLYYKTRKDLYDDILAVCKELGYEQRLKDEWEDILNCKIPYSPFNNKMIREILKE